MDSSGSSAEPPRPAPTHRILELIGMAIACVTLTLPLLLIASYSPLEEANPFVPANQATEVIRE